MILKIGLTDSSGFRFIDNITEINVEETSPQKMKSSHGETGKKYDKYFLSTYEYVFENGKYLFKPIGENVFRLREIIIFFNDNSTESIIIDTEAYLMSDAGKTIERI